MKGKLVFFHLLNNYTGSPAVLANVLKVAEKTGWDVHLYTSQTTGFLSGIPNISYHSNLYFRSKYRLITLFSFFFSQVILAFRLIRWWREPCIFYVNTILPFSAVLIAKWLGKRVIVHVHEYEVSPRILNRFLFSVVRKHAGEIVTVSYFLAGSPSLRKVPTRVIPNAVAESFENQAKKNPFRREDFQVLMLASLRPYKGIGEYILLAEELSDLTFVLVLSDQDKDVEDWKSSKQLPSNLRVYSVQKNVIPFFESASLLLNLAHPDKWLETFGMTVLEGMHFGLPALVPTRGGVIELVEDGINGFLVDYTELAKIKSLIQSLANDHQLWNSLSAQAKSKAEAFSFDKFEQKISALLQNEKSYIF